MRTNSPAERIALNPPRQRKPILGWAAYQGKTLVGENNSLPLLRHIWKHDKTITFKSIR